MLVLTRKQNEKIRIGNEITITVLRTKGKGVRLGIEAPAHINVLRGELVFDLPTEELKPASTGAPDPVESASRGAAQARGHRQQPASLWPTTPDRQTHNTEPNTREPDNTEPSSSRNPRPSRQVKASRQEKALTCCSEI
jgi:carbon storage regulator